MKKVLYFLLIVSFLFSNSWVFSQGTGIIEGTVTYNKAEPLPGVVVKAESPVLPQPRYYTTDESGKYRLIDLPPGKDYKLEFRMMGFQTVLRTEIEVQAGKTLEINVQMQEVAFEEQIVISDSSPVFDQSFNDSTVSRHKAERSYYAPSPSSLNEETIGLSVGGAKDIENFRKNIENGYLPLPTDITYEGIYYDYYFDTGQTKECNKLFCPSYSLAVSRDPFSAREEFYMQIGLNSGIKQSDFKRKKLNLVVVLDISGSMSSPFNRYYYDQFGARVPVEEEPQFSGMDKMSVANNTVAGLLGHLKSDDNFGMVTFESRAEIFMPLTNAGEINLAELKSRILNQRSRGGTNMSAGMNLGIFLYESFVDADPREYENRIIFITDAQPNTGDLSEQGMLGMAKRASNNRIYTTFIGVGVDFNTRLIEGITKTKGANYYSVHSGREFMQRMVDEFEYMVTPLVFDLALTFESKGFEIEKVYGSPEADIATGELMRINTLFPSKREGGETKGGIVILKLKKLTEKGRIKLKTSYENREGKIDGDQQYIEFPSHEKDHFDNKGIRKGILLARYVNLMRNWINDERVSCRDSSPVSRSIDMESGILLPPEIDPHGLSQWERQSVPLRVDKEYSYLIERFITYFESETKALGDETLSRETAVMKMLTNYNAENLKADD